MTLEEHLQKNTIALYELPIQLWQKILGEELNFHLGHFADGTVSLEEAMGIATRKLAAQIPSRRIERVLDIGCGWGGPAFELARLWNVEVIGFTASGQQAKFINSLAKLRKLPVSAKAINVENYRFENLGTFDVVWFCEVLEHIVSRRHLLENIHNACRSNSILAIVMNCLTSNIGREDIYNEFLGIQRLETLTELLDMLTGTGWRIVSVEDYTKLTSPTWELLLERVKRVTDHEYQKFCENLATAITAARGLYQNGMLVSVQIVAERCT